MKNINTQSGFTLIELVVVIVILGILAATAAPRFIDLTNDARESVMSGVEGSIRSAVSLTHAKALVDNITDGTFQQGSRHYNVVNSYPAIAGAGTGDASSVANAGNLAELLELDSDITVATVGATLTFTHSGASAANAATCRITYTNAPANGEPTINVPDPFVC